MNFWLRAIAFLLMISSMLVEGCIPDQFTHPTNIARPPDLILLTRDPLFESVSWNMHPSWSPDGCELAFERDSFLEGDRGLYAIQADGTRPTMLWPLGSTMSPAWAPSDDWIACRVFNKHTLMLLNRDGQNGQYVSDQLYDPSWSPDGGRLVCVRYSNSDRDICVINWQGTNFQTLLVGSTDDGDPAWSPDGQRIAFTSNRDGAYNIYVMNVDGTQITQITHTTGDPRGGMIQPTWSPDSTQIAFVCTSGLPFLSEGRLYVVNATGGEPKLLLDAERCHDPAWSPDDAWLAFSYGGRDRSDRVGSDIYLLRMKQ